MDITKTVVIAGLVVTASIVTPYVKRDDEEEQLHTHAENPYLPSAYGGQAVIRNSTSTY